MTQTGEDLLIRSVSIRSVLTWGSVNWVILAVGAVGWPLWAHHPFPRESLSFYELICGQVIVSSMLFGVIAGNRWTLLVNLALILPMDELAGLSSNTPQLQILGGATMVSWWIIGLWILKNACRSEAMRLGVVAAASLFTMGGAIFDYLRCESAAAAGVTNAYQSLSLLPNLCRGGFPSASTTWVQASLPAIFGLLGFGFCRFVKSPSTSLHKAI
jgi:hypothetical protein